MEEGEHGCSPTTLQGELRPGAVDSDGPDSAALEGSDGCGPIILDGVDTTQVHLRTLRSAMGIIPQVDRRLLSLSPP